VFGAVARHHGVFVGKAGREGSSVEPPFGMFVMADVICVRELRYLLRHIIQRTASQKRRILRYG
jgi:hypothetical protein